MKKIIQNALHSFKKYCETDDFLNKENKKEGFYREIFSINFHRLLYLVIFGFLFALVMIFTSPLFREIYPPKNFKLFLILDFTLAGLSAAFFFIIVKQKVNVYGKIKQKHEVILHSVLTFFILWVSIISATEVTTIKGFPTYIAAVFIICSLFYFPGRIIIFYILFGYISLLVSLVLVHHNLTAFTGKLYPLLSLFVIAFGISRFLYRSKAEEFVSGRKLIHVKKELEKTVEERTSELTKTIDKLQRENNIRREYQEKLESTNKELDEANRLKTIFLANMSHEIRTPMNGIVGFSNLLQDESLSIDKRIQYVSIINRNSETLLNLINDILEISLIESNQVKITKKSFSLNQLLNSTISFFETMKKEMNKPGIKLKRQCYFVDNEDFIMSDPDRLQQVLNNIIKNAIKYTEFGEIQLSYSLKDNYLHFCVEDSGIGIPKDEQQFVFEIFRQVGRDGDQSGSEINKNGTGLGLSISKALIEKMGGRIHLESSLGHGTKVDFTLPYVKGERKESKQKRTIVSGEKWADKKMLIVEDDLVSIELYYELLENTGVEIIVAKTGDEAIKKIELIPEIDIVLMDIRLPGMSGLKATEKIKQINKTVPVIAQTAYAMQDDKKKSFSSGCDGFISKPINSNEFFNLIDTFLK